MRNEEFETEKETKIRVEEETNWSAFMEVAWNRNREGKGRELKELMLGIVFHTNM